MAIYEKRYTSESGDFQVWQIRNNGSSRQIWNWDTREDYNENNLIEIPYIESESPIIIEPIIPFEELQNNKMIEIINAFNNQLSNGCIINLPNKEEFIIDCMEKNQSDFSILLNSMQIFNIPETTICDYHNQLHQLKFDEVKQMYLQLLVYIQTLLGKKWILREQIMNAIKKEDFDLISW